MADAGLKLGRDATSCCHCNKCLKHLVVHYKWLISSYVMQHDACHETPQGSWQAQGLQMHGHVLTKAAAEPLPM
jgi:hypothetical protein